VTNKKKQVLIGSPVHQKPHILSKFLDSLIRLKHHEIELGFFFINDNVDDTSSEMLQRFSCKTDAVTIQQSNQRDHYERSEITHHWNEQLIWKVADFKNQIIEHATREEYDYLFLVDSDLLLHADILEHLIQTNKDIISEIFWTSWQPDSTPQPQVWISDEYTQWEKHRGEVLSETEIKARYDQFISKLKVPGVYEVGGLGACTLISRHALLSGVNYQPIHNVSFWGEDRHFCIRAAALGFSLYVDTHYPAYHIYREADLEGAEQFLEDSRGETKALPKITLTMVVRNESNRFLEEVLQEHRKYIDAAVIIDDGSTDDTVAVCLEVLQGIPVRLVRNEHSKFHNEVELRKQQWAETIETDPDWILNLDADEMFERRFVAEVHQLVLQQEIDVFCFRLYDFWDDIHYREDDSWKSHFTYRPFLIRYRKDFVYKWKDTPQHCGRFPENVFELPHKLSELRVKHLGWSRFKYRLEKYQRYMQLDPEGIYGSKQQYETILDVSPNLVAWVEGDTHTRELKIIHTLPLWIRSECRNDDFAMALACLSSLRGSKNQLVIIYNQGCMSNHEWKVLLSSLDIPAVILGNGENVGIAQARQACFEYIWDKYSYVTYVSEIHVDMIFPMDWFQPLIDYLEHSAEPMISPGIVTKDGAMQPVRGHVEIPPDSSDLCSRLEGLARNEICEGFVHPVVHKAKVLQAIGGYDIRFLKGKQGYEDDSLLLGYFYYMGTRLNWRPKCNLRSWVYHATMAQRMSDTDKHLDFAINSEGLLNQYGENGMLQLSKLHSNQESGEVILIKSLGEKMSDIQQKQVWDQLWTGKVSYEWDPLSQAIYEAIVVRVKGTSSKNMMEAGSGTGKISLRFANEGADITLVDYSEQALLNSREAFRQMNLTGSFVLSDIRSMNIPDNSFDTTWNAGVLEHFSFEERVNILKEMARVTKPEGLVLVLVPNAKCLPYRVGKAFAETNGTWMYGIEEPVMSLQEEFDQCGISLVEETDIGFMNSLDFLDFIPDAHSVKKRIGDWFEGLSSSEKSLFPGYLLLSVGKVKP
jgi:2-polyprenyl-3-methyl-5-hydroxy-6-metoxy-1,4-benzoquinol methylase/GT2 family glycosyltransferase